MPSTTTKKMRTKRPDTRPNEKERRKIGKKIEAQKVVQELRVTRKRKSDHVERVVERAPEVKKCLPENEKVELFCIAFLHLRGILFVICDTELLLI
jgi:hypothetical protein